MGVIWKNIDGFDNRYEVNDKGVIRTKDRRLKIKYFRWGNNLCVFLFNKGALKRKCVQVKRAVWEAFNGKANIGYNILIRNIDGDIYNNRLSNLNLEYNKKVEIQETLKNETWIDINGYERWYQVSNLGRIRSVDRLIYFKGDNHFYSGKVIRLTKSNKGYVVCKLCKNGGSKTFSVHALVFDHFGEEKRCGIKKKNLKKHIDHKDNNRSNNNINNLQLITARDNVGKEHQFNSFSSKHPGVYRKKGKWAANIKVKGKRIYLGSFENENDAAKIYKKTKEGLRAE